MALLPIPKDFGTGGANIGDGNPRLSAVLQNHSDEIATASTEAATALAASTGAQSGLDDLTVLVEDRNDPTNPDGWLAALPHLPRQAQPQLPDGDATVFVMTTSIDQTHGHAFLMGQIPAVAIMTADRTITLGTTNATNKDRITILRQDISSHLLNVVNGGVGGGTLYSFPASRTRTATFLFDGTNWALEAHFQPQAH